MGSPFRADGRTTFVLLSWALSALSSSFDSAQGGLHGSGHAFYPKCKTRLFKTPYENHPCHADGAARAEKSLACCASLGDCDHRSLQVSPWCPAVRLELWCWLCNKPHRRRSEPKTSREPFLRDPTPSSPSWGVIRFACDVGGCCSLCRGYSKDGL